MAEGKSALRKRFLSLRAKAHAAATPAGTAAMEKNLRAIPAFAGARTLLLYVSKDSEAPTLPLIARLLFEGRRVALPKTHVREKRMELFRVRSPDDLRPSSFGIPEPDPSSCEPCAPSSIGAAVIPGVAFDLSGHRLGHGLGFYDRFLPALSCPLIGLAYDAQITDALPAEKHDVALNYVVTEKRVLRPSPRP